MNKLVALLLALLISGLPALADPLSVVQNNLKVKGTLTVTGAQTLTGNTTLSGNLAVGGTLSVTGASTHTGAVTNSSTLTQTGVATFTVAPVLTTGTITANGDTLTIQDLGNANFVQSEGAQTINGVKTFGSAPVLSTATFTTNGDTITLQDLGNANLVQSEGAQTINGVKTFDNNGIKIEDSNASHGVTISPGDESADRVLSIPVLGAADTVMTLGTAQTVTGIKTLTAGTGSGTYVASGNVNFQTNQVATGADTNETDGHSFTLPANSLNANGRGVTVTAWGTTAANGNNKTFKWYWGGTSVYTTGAVAANAKPYRIRMTVIRTSAGNQKIYFDGDFNGAAITGTTITTQTKDETATQVIKSTLTNGTASASDITVDGMETRYF